MRLDARNMVKRFGGITALDGVDLHLDDREILGLIGPNGSGKTTLVNCISGVLDADEGVVTLDTISLTGASLVARSRGGIARTFQNLRLFDDLSVWENVAVAGERRVFGHANPDHVRSLIDRLNLEHVVGSPVVDLPYGTRRRVEVARALASRPRVLLLDEPAAGLNDDETTDLSRLIREVRDDFDCSIIAIDHDMNLIRGISDRVQVLDEGRVIYVGDPDQTFEQPSVIEAYLGAPR